VKKPPDQEKSQKKGKAEKGGKIVEAKLKGFKWQKKKRRGRGRKARTAQEKGGGGQRRFKCSEKALGKDGKKNVRRGGVILT